ncbi:MAG: hypothetical protein PWQ12_647 [Clostridiales bacterium]|nr:hypothetical protein [Clostridiales bacterium]
MFQKKESEVNFDIIIGPNSLIKGDIESEGSIRVDGKVIGNIKSLGNVIISENAFVKGDVSSLSAEIYGACEGDVTVQGKVNLHQNSTLRGDVIAKSLTTKEGALFKGNCTVDPKEELKISLDLYLEAQNMNSSNLVNFSVKSNTAPKEKDKEKTDESTQKENHA